MISWIQVALLGLVSCCAASTITCLSTTAGNYTLNRPLIAFVFIGLILGDVKGCIQIAVPMQIIYIALVTPGDTVAADLRAVSYIGIPLTWAFTKSQSLGLGDSKASGLAGALGTAVGTVGTVQFYGTAMTNLVWQHVGWTRLDKENFSIVGKTEVIFPLISHLLISFTPVMLVVYYGADAVDQFKEALPMGFWYMKSLFILGSLLPAVGIAVLLKSVVNKVTDLTSLLFGFTLTGSIHLTLIATTTVDTVFTLISYQMTMIRNRAAAGPAGIDDDEENIQLRKRYRKNH